MPLKISDCTILLCGFVCAGIALFCLGGCEGNPPSPRSVCSRTDPNPTPYSRGGGYYYTCIEWKLACIQPLVMDEKDGKLICRLRRADEVQ